MAADIQNKMETFNASFYARLDQLSTVCRSSLNAERARDTTSPPLTTNTIVDRRPNIVVFGAAENQDPSAWRQNVETILEFVRGQLVDVVDIFRLGRFSSEKTVPCS
jgi:hypothetical protein